MNKILLAPSLVVLLGVPGGLLAEGQAISPSKGEEGISFSTTGDRASVALGDRVVVTYAARIPAGATLTLDALVTPAPEDGARPPGGAGGFGFLSRLDVVEDDACPDKRLPRVRARRGALSELDAVG